MSALKSLAFTTLPKIGANPTLDRRTNMVTGPRPGKTQRPRPERSLGGVGRIASRLIISEEVEDETICVIPTRSGSDSFGIPKSAAT